MKTSFRSFCKIAVVVYTILLGWLASAGNWWDDEDSVKDTVAGKGGVCKLHIPEFLGYKFGKRYSKGDYLYEKKSLDAHEVQIMVHDTFLSDVYHKKGVCYIAKEDQKCAKESVKFRNADTIAIECLKDGRVCRITAVWGYTSGKSCSALEKAVKEKTLIMDMYEKKYGVEFTRMRYREDGSWSAVSEEWPWKEVDEKWWELTTMDHWCVGDASSVKLKIQHIVGAPSLYLIVEDNALMRERAQSISVEKKSELDRSVPSTQEGIDQI